MYFHVWFIEWISFYAEINNTTIPGPIPSEYLLDETRDIPKTKILHLKNCAIKNIKTPQIRLTKKKSQIKILQKKNNQTNNLKLIN